MGISRTGSALLGVAIIAATLSACGSASTPGDQHPSEVPVGPTAYLALRATPTAGTSTVSDATLAEVRALLQRRIDAANIAGASISVHNDTILISAPASYATALRRLGSVPKLRFRQVLEVGNFQPPVASNTTATSRTGEASALAAITRPFDRWNCAKDPNPTGGNDNPSDYIVACDPAQPQSGANLKYILAPAAVEGAQLKEADAGLAVNGVGWQVNIAFTNSGTGAWLALTKRAFDATGSGSSGFGMCHPPKGCNAVAIVLDGIVLSAPAIQQAGGIPGGRAQITGNFNEASASDLAAVLKLGVLPVQLRIKSFKTV